MKKFKTLIIGSSFSAIGYAEHTANTLIIEESEMLDTSFYLPMRGFEGSPYAAKTEKGKELLQIFSDLGIISDSGMNVNAFEIGLCRYAQRNPKSIYLKCRFVAAERTDDGYTATLLHNGGLERISAEKIIDTRAAYPTKQSLAVIFDANGGELNVDEITRVFKNSEPRVAFYEGRYVLYAKTNATDINDAKAEIINKWTELSGYRILYIAPVFYQIYDKYPKLSDGTFDNPIEAFEYGMRFAREEDGV